MEPIPLDIRTFLLAMGVFAFGTAIMCYSFTFTFSKRLRGLTTWASGMLVMSCAFFLFMLREYIPNLYSYYFGNMAVFTSVLFMLLGLLKYHQKDLFFTKVTLVIFTLAAVIISYLTLTNPQFTLPPLAISILLSTIAIFLLAASYLAFRNERKIITIYSVLSGLSLVLLSLVNLRRAIRVFYSLEEGNLFSTTSVLAQVVLYGSIGICIVFTSLGFIMMTMDRLNFESMKKIALNEHTNRLASLGEMAAGVAHEINNPLTIIQFNLKKIKNLIPPEWEQKEKMEESVGRTQYAADRVSKIIKGLLDFSKEGVQEKFSLHALNQIVQDTLLFCAERIKSKEIQLTVAECPDVQMNCHPIQISQVLLNIINNAVDAVAEEKEKNILISFSVDSKWVYISVKNSGEPIPIEIRKKIFQPFFTTKEVGKGTGLGLSICLGIAEKHKGRLYLDEQSPKTTPSMTTCFVLQLPLA